MSAEQHRAASVGESLRCAVITCSDTRSLEEDESGNLIVELLGDAGHRVVSRQIVVENPDSIKLAFDAGRLDAEVVIFTGGTGIAGRDLTPDVVVPLLDRELPGFGELFRLLSYKEIGAAAMLSRAFAGVRDRSIVFALPGSTKAVRLALDGLILPEIGHLVGQIRP